MRRKAQVLSGIGFSNSDYFGECSVDFADFVGVFVDGNDFENILKRRGSSKQRKWYLADFVRVFVDGNDFENILKRQGSSRQGKWLPPAKSRFPS